MKKLVLLTSALTLISTSAMASQARLLALGMKETDNEGMYHISDARNIFLNPAYINVYNNYIQAEYGRIGQTIATPSSTDSYATIDNTTSPKAMGGFFKKSGDFVYGFYLGNESNTSSLLRIVGTSAIATLDGSNGAGANSNSKMLYSTDNQIDLFFGGDNGVKWAGNVLFANGKNDSRKAKDTAAAARFGVIGSGWDAHANISLASKAEATDTVTAFGGAVNVVPVTQEFKGKLGVHVGGSYVISGNNRVFGYVKHYGWEQKDSFSGYVGPLAALGGKTGTTKGDFTSYHLGWGSHMDVNTNDKVYFSVAGKKTDINAEFTTKGEIRHIVVPVSIAYEGIATEWLTFRGSIIQNIWGQRDNKGNASMNPVARNVVSGIYGGDGKATISNSTEVNAGASFTFGKLVMDGLVGAKATGSLKTDDLLTKAAVTYNF